MHAVAHSVAARSRISHYGFRTSEGLSFRKIPPKSLRIDAAHEADFSERTFLDTGIVVSAVYEIDPVNFTVVFIESPAAKHYEGISII